jgi:hypothetical protein
LPDATPAGAGAFLALWNDVDASHVDEYEAWHTFEHVPERVANPGFLAGRRYRAAERFTARYFTLYLLESLDALRTARYADVVEHPTPWSARMRPLLRNFRRHACDVAARAGEQCGGAIVTATVDGAVPSHALDGASVEDGVVATWHGDADTSSRFPLAPALATPDVAGARHVVLVEAQDRACGEAAMSTLLARAEIDAGRVRRASYDFVLEVIHNSTDSRRPPARDDLRARWERA